MTAILVAILAALGVGGGFVIANNSGHGSSSQAAISGTAQDYWAKNINPDYTLISALSDTDQYQPSVSFADNFFEEYNNASALQNNFITATDTDYSIYGNPEDDLRNGLIRGEQIQGTPYWATLNLLKAKGTFLIASLEGTSIDNSGNVQQQIQLFELTRSNFDAPASVHGRYSTFTKRDADIVSPDQSKVFKHYNSVHLGGEALGLSVADFGHWDEKAWKENNGVPNLYMHNNKTFFFYDERFAYKGFYYKQQATMHGNVLVSVLGNNESVDGVYNLQTGTISMTLDLLNKTITNGTVVMDDENYRTLYDVPNFTGSIKGSVFIIDGTFLTGEPQVGELRGGVGKLLIGISGLEMVGNFTKQIEYNGELDSENHPDYEHGKADYTFGAREN